MALTTLKSSIFQILEARAPSSIFAQNMRKSWENKNHRERGGGGGDKKQKPSMLRKLLQRGNMTLRKPYRRYELPEIIAQISIAPHLPTTPPVESVFQ